jgi:hypothetical protein
MMKLWLAALALLPTPALAATWTCRVTDALFGHGPVLDAAGTPLTITLTGTDQAYVVWNDLNITLTQTTDPLQGPLPFQGADTSGTEWAMSFAPGDTAILSARPAGIEFGIFAACPATPTDP